MTDQFGESTDMTDMPEVIEFQGLSWVRRDVVLDRIAETEKLLRVEIERLLGENAELHGQYDRLCRLTADLRAEYKRLYQTPWNVPESIRLKAEDDARKQRLAGGELAEKCLTATVRLTGSEEPRIVAGGDK